MYKSTEPHQALHLEFEGDERPGERQSRRVRSSPSGTSRCATKMTGLQPNEKWRHCGRGWPTRSVLPQYFRMALWGPNLLQILESRVESNFSTFVESACWPSSNPILDKLSLDEDNSVVDNEAPTHALREIILVMDKYNEIGITEYND